MNRRSFFRTLATAAAGFTILPPATTYERIWKPAPKQWIPNPEWETAQYEIRLVDGEPVFDEMILSGEWKWHSVRGLAAAAYEPLLRYRSENGQLKSVDRWVQV